MADTTAEQHNRLIVQQFTQMAKPFADMPEHSNEQAMQLLAGAAALTKEDLVLDVCCGTGIVACALAPDAKHVIGIDLTPAMIEQARRLQERAGLKNLSWHVGDVSALPFADGAFSVVVSRYAFHHLVDPVKVLQEMARVCKPGGRLVLVDVFARGAEQGAAYDRLEKLRDPSHMRALRLEEFTSIFAAAGVPITTTEFYRLAVGLEPCLHATATAPEAAEQVRRLLAADIGHDETGMSPHRVGDAIHFSFPILVIAGQTETRRRD